MKPVKYKLKEVAPSVFLCAMKDPYDLAMTFCRVQEYYESPYKEIRGKVFSIAEYQRLYTHERGEKSFTYPTDWFGFNVPSIAIESLYSQSIPDLNLYDNVILKIHNQDVPAITNYKYYLIGATENAWGTVRHEVCHGLYYTDSSYRETVDELVDSISASQEQKMTKFLKDMGYCQEVIKDEIQAYLSTTPDVFEIDIEEGSDFCNVVQELQHNLEIYLDDNEIDI
jgi:hypothetical protein